jgi:nitrogen regulatory protein P-II 2
MGASQLRPSAARGVLARVVHCQKMTAHPSEPCDDEAGGRRCGVPLKGRAMKYVTAFIKPHKLDEVREALHDAGVQGLSVTEVRGFGRQKGHTEIYRGAEYTVEFVAKIKIETAVKSDVVEQVVEAIEKSARTGSIGDGKVFVWDLEQALRIRTGEKDTNAL